MKRALLVLAVAACSSGNNSLGGDDYPIIPTGSAPPIGQGSGDPADGSVSDGGDGGTQLTGRICVLSDLRNAGSTTGCGPAGSPSAGGLNVRLDGALVRTATDGTFTIPAPTGTDAVWKIDDGGAEQFITSFVPYAGQTVVPVLSRDGFLALEGGSNFQLSADAGLVLVRVLRGSAPVANVTGAVDVPTDAVSLYDGDTLDQWNDTTATGPKGLVLFANVAANPSGAATPATAKLKVGATTVPVLMTVWDQSITFLTKTVQ